MITKHKVKRAVVNLLKKSQTELGEDVLNLLKLAYETETSAIGKKTLEMILEAVDVSKARKVPICQDTGIPIFFLEIGRNLSLDFDIYDAITEGVRIATKEIPLRPNAVDPISRINSGDNTGIGIPVFYTKIVEGDKLRISVISKGAGSENVSRLKMLRPDPEKIFEFILETVMLAGGKPCPPIIIGVGIGSSFDGAARLAKEALLRNVNKMTPFEIKIRDKINELGIGPMGLGGNWTALAVLIETNYCHTASLPVAVNIQCWVHRKASAVIV